MATGLNSHFLVSLSLTDTPQDIIYSRFGMWSSISSLHNISSTQFTERVPAYSQSLYLYSDCLARVSLSYSFYPNFSESVESHHFLSCLQQLQTSVRSIPRDKKPPAHHFYPYHQEIGALLHLIVTASSTVFTARYSLSSWLTSLQADNISSLLSSASLRLVLESYNQTGTHLREAIALQNSFHYIEPEGFYLSVTECYLPFLREVRGVLLFLKGLMQSFASPLKDSSLQSFDHLILHLTQATGIEDIELLSLEEKRRRFPLRASVWHQRSVARTQEMIQREKETEQWEHGGEELSRTDRFEAMTQWFEKEHRKQWNFDPQISSSSAKFSMTGSCCELLYC
jgi:hypothetical protein